MNQHDVSLIHVMKASDSYYCHIITGEGIALAPSGAIGQGHHWAHDTDE
jgi:hypothetical protein